MSDSPITRPLEQSEIKNLSGGDPYRLEMLTSQKNQERIMAELRQEMKEMGRWQITHDKADALEFQKIHAHIRAIKAGAVQINNGVEDYNNNKQQFKGAWKAIAILFAIATALSGLAGWLWDHFIALFQKGHP